jgi:HD-like signal output (HDOD) protein
MATQSILLAVPDPQALADISQALGAEWMPTAVGTEEEAISQLEKYSFTAILADFNLGSPDASDLLNLALDKRPETTRFLLAYEADLALVAAKVHGEPQILPKPIEFASLKSRLEDGIAPQSSNAKQDENAEAPDNSASPLVPPVYSKVLKALESSDVTPAQVGEIIAEDAGLTGEILRLTNSTYLGTPRNIIDPTEAVGWLGLDTVRALIKAMRFMAEHGHLKPGYLSLEKIWQHSTSVALIARDLVLSETRDRTLASQAFVAGLVHDLGKVVLATNFDDLYGRVHSLARKQPVPIWEVEKEMFGANHGEIGGCLVGMWNLPLSIVDATALHHDPPLSEDQELTPLAAVHIANVLEHELGQTNEFRVAPIIDTRFLNHVGLLQRLPIWRAAVANGSPVEADPNFSSSEISLTRSGGFELPNTLPTRPAGQLLGSISGTRGGRSGHPKLGRGLSAIPGSGHRKSGWTYLGVACAALFLLAIWLDLRPQSTQSIPTYARGPGETGLGLTPTASPEAVPTAMPDVAPQPTVSLPALATTPSASAPAVSANEMPAASTPAIPVAERGPAQVSSSQQASTASEAPSTNSLPIPKPQPEATAASTAPAVSTNTLNQVRPENPQPEFHLNGIIYTAAHPSAMVNGQTLAVGDEINGATVLSISRDKVTLSVNGQHKTLELPK